MDTIAIILVIVCGILWLYQIYNQRCVSEINVIFELSKKHYGWKSDYKTLQADIQYLSFYKCYTIDGKKCKKELIKLWQEKLKLINTLIEFNK